MKRALQFVTVFAAAAMLNGCSKCSGNNPPAETAAPAVENAAPPAAPTEAPAAEGTAPAPAQGGEAAPAPTEAK